MSARDTVFQGGRRLLRWSGGLAAAGLLLSIAGALVDRGRFFAAYLTAYAYVASLALGALTFLMIGHAMRAGWPTLLRRLTEGFASTFPVLAVLFVPLLFGLRTLYPWLRIDTIADAREREVVELKAPYLNLGWFLGRTAVFLAIWIFVSHWLRRWSNAPDGEVARVARQRMYVASGVLLPVVAISLSFASFDWLMSLMPAWYSTMFPVYYFAGGFLGSLALLTLATAAADRSGAIEGINDSHYYALGRLLLAFVIFWAYVAFFQVMLIWMANRPEEVTFYLARTRGPWRAVSVILAVTQFVVPFFALLGYAVKRRRRPLAAIAVWLLVAHYIDLQWLVMPAARPTGAALSWIDLGPLLFVGGITVVYAITRMRGRPLVPVHDPALPRALRYESL